MARAIVADGYGQNDRLSYAFQPKTMQDPNLSRWEKVFAIPGVLPTDPIPVRQKRVMAAFLRFGKGNIYQAISDAMTNVLGPVFLGLVTFNLSNSVSYWPGGTPNAQYPWTSSLAMMNVGVTYQLPQYIVNDGSAQGQPNGAWWNLIGQAKTVLDAILPAWATFSVFVDASSKDMNFRWDEHNVDLEAFGS